MEKLDRFVSAALHNVVSIGIKKASKNRIPELKTDRFDYSDVCGSRYTAGFGKAVMLPGDIEKKKYYIAGYGENNPARGVIDPQYAHAFWLDDNTGRGGMLFVSLDVVGLLRKDVNDLKAYIADLTDSAGCRLVSVFCTHNHAGIDTMGIWGPLPRSGKNPGFMKILFDAVRSSVKTAIESRKDGRLYYGTIEVPDMQEDIRTPVCYSKTLTRFRFVPDDGSGDICFINFASHSESLQGCNHLVSADFPCYLREKVRKETGAETIYGVGAIGGMISMDIPDEDTLRKEHRLIENTRNIGYKLADYALNIENEKELSPRMSFARREFICPVENPVLTVACQLGILSVDRYEMPGRKGTGALISEISYIEIDGVKILMIPCELFPELAYGGYLSADESATGRGEEVNPVPLTEIAGDELLVFGLANDELGYVIPPNDYLLNEVQPYIDKVIDRHGRRHYEETNSTGPETAGIIADNFRTLMDEVKAVKQNGG